MLCFVIVFVCSPIHNNFFSRSESLSQPGSHSSDTTATTVESLVIPQTLIVSEESIPQTHHITPSRSPRFTEPPYTETTMRFNEPLLATGSVASLATISSAPGHVQPWSPSQLRPQLKSPGNRKAAALLSSFLRNLELPELVARPQLVVAPLRFVKRSPLSDKASVDVQETLHHSSPFGQFAATETELGTVMRIDAGPNPLLFLPAQSVGIPSLTPPLHSCPVSPIPLTPSPTMLDLPLKTPSMAFPPTPQMQTPVSAPVQSSVAFTESPAAVPLHTSPHLISHTMLLSSEIPQSSLLMALSEVSPPPRSEASPPLQSEATPPPYQGVKTLSPVLPSELLTGGSIPKSIPTACFGTIAPIESISVYPAMQLLSIPVDGTAEPLLASPNSRQPVSQIQENSLFFGSLIFEFHLFV